MNAMGYYSLQKDKFITTDEAEGKEAEWLEKHSILQYNNIFDYKNKNNIFYIEGYSHEQVAADVASGIAKNLERSAVKVGK